MIMPTYTVSTYDMNDCPGKDGKWTEVAEGVTKWGLRPILRELYGQGYSNVSIAVDRED